VRLRKGVRPRGGAAVQVICLCLPCPAPRFPPPPMPLLRLAGGFLFLLLLPSRSVASCCCFLQPPPHHPPRPATNTNHHPRLPRSVPSRLLLPFPLRLLLSPPSLPFSASRGGGRPLAGHRRPPVGPTALPHPPPLLALSVRRRAGN
jgi:hypothetical protein